MTVAGQAIGPEDTPARYVFCLVEHLGDDPLPVAAR